MFISAKIELRETVKGKSVFAKVPIFTDEVIFIFEQSFTDQPDQYSIQIDQHKHLKSLRKINDFINHSCLPNCYIDFAQLHFKSLKPITQDEEITFNYLTTEWQLTFPFTCQCGNINCLNQIQGFKYLNLAQRQQLQPFLSPYLKQKILDFEGK
jgi:hypothetical protein